MPNNTIEQYNFYVFFPGGYKNRVSDVIKDIIDIFVMKKNDREKVYLGTLYTSSMVNDIFQSGELFIAERNMIIIKDLNRSTVYKAIEKIIDDNYLDNILSYDEYVNIFETKDIRYDLL